MRATKVRDEYFKENPKIAIAFKFAKMLKEARKESGFTQLELAKKMKSTQPSIARAESGSNIVTFTYMEKYLKACGKKLKLPSFNDETL